MHDDYPPWSTLIDDPAYCLGHQPVRPQASDADTALVASYNKAVAQVPPPVRTLSADQRRAYDRTRRKASEGRRRR